MPELVRSHVNADVPRKGVDDLLRYGGLALPTASFGDEKRTIHVSAEPLKHVTAIPSKAASNLVRNLCDDVQFFGLRVPRGNVKDQLTTGAIRLAEVGLPVQRAEVLRSERHGKYDINRDRDLGGDKSDAAIFQVLGNFGHQLLGQEKQLGTNALGLQLSQQALVLLCEVIRQRRKITGQTLKLSNLH